MAKGVTIQISGDKQLLKKLNRFTQDVVDVVDVEMSAAGLQYVDLAVAAAPRDQGKLIQGISHRKVADLHHEIVSADQISAWLEWGTRSRVQVPSDLQAYAAQFKGSKTNGGDFKKAIFDWCKRKGIEQEYWWPIFIKILRLGINPHPFFFQHREPIRKQLNQNIKAAIRKVINK